MKLSMFFGYCLFSSPFNVSFEVFFENLLNPCLNCEILGSIMMLISGTEIAKYKPGVN